MATQDLSALFQGMGNAQPQPNPLAQMMAGGGGIEQPPSAAPAPPEVPGQPPMPGAIPGAPPDPLAQSIKELEAKLRQNIDDLSKYHKDPSQFLPEALKNFDKYNEQKYQQTYGGGGVLGTAGRALANLLSGLTHGGQSIKETLATQNRKDWEAAVKDAQMQVAQQKSDQLGQMQQQNTLLQTLKAQQQAQQYQQTLAVQQQKANTEQYKAENPEPKKGPTMTGEDLITVLGKKTITTADGKEISIDPTKYYETQSIPGKGVVNAAPVAPPGEIRTRQDWAKNAQGQWEAVLINGKGEITGKVPGLQPPASITGTVSTKTVFKTAHDLDGNEYYIPVQEGSASTPANQGTPKAPASGATITPGAATTSPGMPTGTIKGGVATTSAIKDTRAFARSVLTHVPEIYSNIDNLDKSGKLGVIGSRWNDFMAGKVGTGDPDFEKLRVDISLIKSALGRIHGGARGGGSIQMVERFDKLINAGTMDATTLKSGLKAAADWIDTYKDLGEQTTKPLSADEFKKKHGIK